MSDVENFGHPEFGEEAVDMFITHSIRALKLITLKYPDLMPSATVEITHYTKIASHVFIM